MKKKKKNGCLGCLGVLFLIGAIGLFLPKSKETAVNTTPSSSSVAISSSSTPDSSSETTTTSSSTESPTTGDFAPQDSTDATIESIKTYNDYMVMYEFILNEYYVNAEAAFAQYGLTDDGSFAAQRESLSQQLEAERKQYSLLGKAPLVGIKSELVKYLKDLRDGLKEYTDALAQGAVE